MNDKKNGKTFPVKLVSATGISRITLGCMTQVKNKFYLERQKSICLSISLVFYQAFANETSPLNI